MPTVLVLTIKVRSPTTSLEDHAKAPYKFMNIMKTIIAIGAGSFFGGILRYLLSVLINTRSISGFPYGTLCVNVLGCLLIGFVYGLTDKNLLSENWRLFFATGVLGGFTTFSAFSYESFSMIRDGNLSNALFYIAVSVLIGLLATYGGYEFSSKL